MYLDKQSLSFASISLTEYCSSKKYFDEIQTTTIKYKQRKKGQGNAQKLKKGYKRTHKNNSKNVGKTHKHKKMEYIKKTTKTRKQSNTE